MKSKKALVQKIKTAFSKNEFPGQGKLTNSYESEEAASIDAVFADKQDWQTIPASFLDVAPDGYSSALSFFSKQAFHFYLPAYMLADISGALQSVDVIFHLCHGLERSSRDKKINPLRYGDKTWAEYARERFALFSAEQTQAVSAYLECCHDTQNLVAFEKKRISEALVYYWSRRGKK